MRKTVFNLEEQKLSKKVKVSTLTTTYYDKTAPKEEIIFHQPRMIPEMY